LSTSLGATFTYNAASQLSAMVASNEYTLTYGGTGQDDLTSVGSIILVNSDLGLTQEKIPLAADANYFARMPNGLLIDERLYGNSYGPGAGYHDYNPLYDAQGDIIAFVNSAGEVAYPHYKYAPYDENSKNESRETIPLRVFGYKGGYTMPVGNYWLLMHFGQRYYDPTTGSWTQQDARDRTTSATQADRFAFGGDDPINLGDPSGRSVEAYAEDCATGAVAGAAGGVEGAAVGCGVSAGIRGAAELLSESGGEEEEELEQGEVISEIFG